MLTKKVLERFGLKKNPFDAAGDFEGRNYLQVIEFAQTILESRGLGAIAGPVGCGKTRAISAFCAEYLDDEGRSIEPSVRILKTLAPYTLHLTAQSLVHKLIQEFAPERSVPTPLELKMLRLQAALGPEGIKNKVLVIIDEAHDLRPDTLKAIKTLRELSWLGKAPLFGVLLVGEPFLAQKIRNIKKVSLRCETLTLEEPASAEIKAYIEHCGVKRFLTPAALEFTARASDSYLRARGLIESGLNKIFWAGRNKIELDDLLGCLGNSLKPLVEAVGAEASELAECTGIAAKNVAAALNGHGDKANVEKLKNALVKDLMAQAKAG